jgi:mannose-1-phosphate guanylyltransferase/mannose-6-phosphate isomerase
MTLGKIHPVILSGGAGTRLWPLSRALYPKQFLGLASEESPLEQTLARVADPVRFAAPLVVCNEKHRFLVGDALRRRGAAAEAILVEPVARNTGPAACTAALKLAERDPQALVLLLPSDHRIAEEARFLAAVDQAAQAAAAGRLVTFGITPNRPETGYGYIHCAEPLEGLPGCHRVARFVEKPDQATAEGYLASGGYAWNSGMFLFAANRLIEELERHAPDIVAASRAALAAAATDLDFLRLDEESFARAPSISIDYAVMEKTEHAAVVPAEMGWTDLGSWETLWQISDTDTAGNALIGDVIARDARDNYLRSDGRLLAVLGVSGLVVVALRDAVLVCARERAQDIRQVVDALEAAGREEHRLHPRVARPWGSYESIDADDGFQAKRLIIKPGASISLQRHRHRAEHWVVVRGQAEVTRDDEVFTLEVDQSAYIPCGAVHRLRNPGTEELHIVEIQSGDYLGEDDIERFEDIYGRR